jgi:tetratricopeptide (TPR) repeat protein
MFKEIDKYIKEKNYVDALIHLKNLENTQSSQTNKYNFLLAHVAFICEKYDLAKKQYEVIFTKKIQNVRSYLEYTKILLNNNNFKKARKYLEMGIKQYPENAPLIRTLIRTIQKQSNYEYEYEYKLCQRLLEIDYGNKISHKLMINVLMQLQNYRELKLAIFNAKSHFGENEFLIEEIKYYTAIKSFGVVLEKYNELEVANPENYIVYIGQMRTLDALGRFEESEKYLLKGLENIKDNNKTRIFKALVNFYTRLEKYNKAVKYSNLLITLEPLKIENYIMLSNVFKKKSEYTNALEILLAIEKDSKLEEMDEDIRVSFHLAKYHLYFDLESYSNALKEINAALSLKTDNDELNLQLGIVYMKLLNYDFSEKIFSHILQTNPNFKKANTYLIAVERERERYNAKVEFYNKLSMSIPKINVDYLALIDMKSEYAKTVEVIELCQKQLTVDPDNEEIISRLIILLMENENFVDASYYWTKLLAGNVLVSHLLFIYRSSEKFALMLNYINVLRMNTMSKIEQFLEQEKKTFHPKNVAILGGSNSIMRDGWAPVFTQHMLKLFDVKVDNYGLGGISSLYGLYIAKEKKLFKQYDTIVFEYTLNDIYFDYFNGYDYVLLESVLRALAVEAKKYNSQIIFVLMSPFDNVDNLVKNRCEITKIYKNITLEYENTFMFDVYQEMKLNQYSSKNFVNMLYRDNMHYSSKFAKNIADVFSVKLFKNKLENKRRKMKKSRKILDTLNLDNLTFLKPDCFKIDGSSKYILRETKIISREFLCMGSMTTLKVKIPKGKRVLALLINSSENTGYIRVKFGEKVFIKNIFAERPINDPIKARIYLKQFTSILVNHKKDSYLEISTGISNEELQNMNMDVTVYPQPPRVELCKQELEIAGVLIS